MYSLKIFTCYNIFGHFLNKRNKKATLFKFCGTTVQCVNIDSHPKIDEKY